MSPRPPDFDRLLAAVPPVAPSTGYIADASFGRDEPFVTYIDETTGANLVMFSSGGSDGRYATWVGFTADGEVACFLTDFRVLA